MSLRESRGGSLTMSPRKSHWTAIKRAALSSLGFFVLFAGMYKIGWRGGGRGHRHPYADFTSWQEVAQMAPFFVGFALLIGVAVYLYWWRSK